MLNFETVNIIDIVLVLLGVYLYMKQNDEFPLILAIFNYSICISRYKLIQEGVIDYVRVNYEFNIFHLDDEKAIIAMNYIMLGTICFFVFYLIFKNQYKSKPQHILDKQSTLTSFIKINQTKIIGGFLMFFAVNSVLHQNISGPLALGNGYFNLFRLAVGGFNLILGLLIFSGDIPKRQKLWLGFFLFIGIINSYHPNSRFQFLSWAVSITFIIFKHMQPKRKIKYIIPAFVVIVLFFSLLGVDRYSDVKNQSFEENLQQAIERTITNEDQNMLDGFMMILDVYPKNLDYQYGMEHFEILLRPIPRSLWPEKPLGGYANKLGLSDIQSYGTIGISETLYGSFYGEGGVLGIIILSILYAKLIAWLFYMAKKYDSDMQFLIKGVVIASFIPLIRGGDLPGIYAFIGMSFWPVFIFIYQYNIFNKKMKSYEFPQR